MASGWAVWDKDLVSLAFSRVTSFRVALSQLEIIIENRFDVGFDELAGNNSGSEFNRFVILSLPPRTFTFAAFRQLVTWLKLSH